MITLVINLHSSHRLRHLLKGGLWCVSAIHVMHNAWCSLEIIPWACHQHILIGSLRLIMWIQCQETSFRDIMILVQNDVKFLHLISSTLSDLYPPTPLCLYKSITFSFVVLWFLSFHLESPPIFGIWWLHHYFFISAQSISQNLCCAMISCSSET